MQGTKNVQIIPYAAAYRESFRLLNEEWIRKYFDLEEEDHKILNDPEKYILENGGAVFIALYQDKPVGTCALVHDEDYVYELCKMCVSPVAQGNNIGYLLCEAAIEKAKTLGATKIYLESNRILKTAINLYARFGFKEVRDDVSRYRRVDIKMELLLQ